MSIRIGTRKNLPECLAINASLDHEESVSAVVCVDFLTICTEVFGAECTAVPLSNDPPSHVPGPVAVHRFMNDVTKICCFDVDEQPTTAQHERMSKLPSGSPGMSAEEPPDGLWRVGDDDALPRAAPAGYRYLRCS